MADSDLKSSITNHIDDEFKKFTDQDFAKSFHQFINRSDTVPSDFLYKIVEVDQYRNWLHLSGLKVETNDNLCRNH
ncbi:MAG: hypothetical protein R2728_06045 [Chitinophagales bacterium]